MFPNRLWADWKKYLYCYLSGTVMVTIENQWYSNETHCDQSTDSPNNAFCILHIFGFEKEINFAKL